MKGCNTGNIMTKIKIFISYRRADSSKEVKLIYKLLVNHFGADSIFMDIHTIEPGANFLEMIIDALNKCEVVLIVIGNKWLDIEDNNGKRRLDNPDDFVRIEVLTALTNG